MRECGGAATLTWKGPPAAGPLKDREEIETTAGEAAALARILERLGFQPVFRYEKFRTAFAGPDGGGEAVLDETPIGCFLELEGPPEWIGKNAQALGFTADEYITDSYAALYFKDCARRGVEPGHMVFGGPGRAIGDLP